MPAYGKVSNQVLTGKEKSLLEVLEPLAAERGVEIVTLEIVGARKSPTIRVYIDTDHGVGFDELASTQAWVNEVMDSIDPFPGAYMLEVSSPGIDRPLRTPAHFQRCLEQEVSVRTNGPVNGRSSFKGTLLAVSDDTVTVRCDETDYDIPFGAIKRANLVGTVSFK